jgi:hypothetical protein
MQPERPDPGLDMLGAGFIGRRLQRAEQEVQSARAVGADLRQLARRLRQFLLQRRRPGMRILRGRQAGHHGDAGGQQNGGQAATRAWESQCHA